MPKAQKTAIALNQARRSGASIPKYKEGTKSVSEKVLDVVDSTVARASRAGKAVAEGASRLMQRIKPLGATMPLAKPAKPDTARVTAKQKAERYPVGHALHGVSDNEMKTIQEDIERNRKIRDLTP